MSHEQRSQTAPDAYVGTCSVCGKRCFRTRKAARKAQRRAFPGDCQRAYQCGEFWHFGHHGGAEGSAPEYDGPPPSVLAQIAMVARASQENHVHRA